MSPSQSPVRRAPYLAGNDTLEMSSGPPGASESGASISAQGDRGEESLGGLRAEPWKSSVGWWRWGGGRGAIWGLAGGLFLHQRLATGCLGNKQQTERSHLGNPSV